MRKLLIVPAMVAVGFGASFAGHVGGVFLAGGAPLLALGFGILVLGVVVMVGLWAARNV